ncbi:hypothetical protein [Aliivibrio fischeri]|uniref:hypothetical protein n=1 Tax=Aliivibrio fischeri TaxID=668 RepID=UPI00084C5F2B|nr:hypothetical protein [Aliivibrio fischeri]OED58131.1 hypothetical protein BEI47_20315 [Aliivibrio fischeri]
MTKYIILPLLMVLSGCNIKDDSDITVCAMDHITPTMSNLAVIFESQLELGDWNEVPMSYCDNGAGQLYFNQPDNSISFESKINETTYYSTALDYQLGVNDWFYVENKSEEFEDNPLILKKDENKGIYKVYYLQSESAPLLETSNIEEVKEKYPNLTTDSRAKTAKELENMYLTFINS